MDQTRRTHRVRIGLLVGAHFVLGLIMAVIALSYPGFDWPFWVQVFFLGLIASEILLLGIWLGMVANGWGVKFAAMIVGIGWLTFVSLSSSSNSTFQVNLQIPVILTPLVLLVAGASMCCRRWLATIEKRARWPLRSLPDEMQFSLRSIITLTLSVAVLLALGRLLRSIKTEGIWMDTMLVVCVFSMLALISGAMLIWACLGPGRVRVRVPVALLGMAALGLVFASYFENAPAWRFATWPALMLVISGYVVSSLLVVRSCGYRLVSVWHSSDVALGLERTGESPIAMKEREEGMR